MEDYVECEYCKRQLRGKMRVLVSPLDDYYCSGECLLKKMDPDEYTAEEVVKIINGI